ncbi:hypothetical protein GCM10011409_09620 [Lentibacillus populi]|uniref:Uncharacterized protein n=1 Tax=Lentibacillus populi TaxID=1827502 RepID=A0A9W5TVT2_9BACI|nr:hypothetical protein [Lentibacillus populi]GGB34250.1 hypothetical protein GCM10011409_09620 [Lentibacillus populi]
MSSILLIGLIIMLIIIFFKALIIDMFGNKNKFVKKLKNAKWFQKTWTAGMFLFALNAVLFFFTCLLLYVLTFLPIPYIHWVIMLFAVISSVFSWIVVNKAWQGTKKNRLKLGFIGSSFYLILTIVFIYGFMSLKPAYPGEDTFMSAIGLVFAIIVTAIAFIACLVYTGFSGKAMDRK